MSRKSTLISTLVCAFVLIIMRTLEEMFIINPVSGFYKKGLSWFGIITGVISLLLIGSLVFFCGLNTPVRKKLKAPGIYMAVWSFLMAAILLSTVAVSVVNNAHAASFTAISFLEAVISMLGAAFFVLYGISGIINFQIPAYLPVFLLPLWIYRLAYTFFSLTGMANIADNIYTILMLCASTVFYLFIAKAMSGISVKNNLSVGIPVGLAASILSFVCTVPRFIITVFGDKANLHENHGVDLFIFASGVFILALVMKSIKESKTSAQNIYKADGNKSENADDGNESDIDTSQAM